MEIDVALSSDRIVEIGQAFWKSKALLSAVELNLFTVLAADGPLDTGGVCERVGLHDRGARDFLDALVALGLLTRSDDHRYTNTPETDLFLDRRKATYSGGFLELCNARLYRSWADLTSVLQTGRPQSHHAGDGHPDGQYGRLYSDPVRTANLSERDDRRHASGGEGHCRDVQLARLRTVVDVGCAEGCLLVEVAKAHVHIRGYGFDLPTVQAPFERYVRVNGVADRLAFQPGDFHADPLPAADVIVMGRVLHNWNLDTKRRLLTKAWAALPVGGTLLVYERLIDDERRANATALLASLNMLVVTSGGFDFTGADCVEWMRKTGFRRVRVEPLVASHSMVIATK